ncbi:MAG: tetratricopeptide repeat protein [Gammaproteobacteria bacterium]
MSSLLSAVVIGAMLHTSAATPVPAEQLEDGITAFEMQEYDKAMNLIKPLAEQGDPEAQYFMGTFYWYGSGVTRSSPIAQKWFTKAYSTWLAAAEQGDATAMVEVSRMVNSGLGTERDAEQALKWIHKALANGAIEAHGVLGDMYMEGDGVEKSLDEALKHYSKAADLGDPYGVAMVARLGNR